MKRRIILIIAALLLFLIIPLSFVLTGFCTPAQFGETYYGQLPVLYEQLKTTAGKKIVLVGNSALAFGVRRDLLEKELPGYSVVTFGLYGALGTQTMLELSCAYISEGDIVVILPELYEQTCSLYFSPAEVWRAADGDFSILSDVKGEHFFEMAAAFPAYVSEKFGYLTGDEEPQLTGAYRRDAFEDENGVNVGYMTYDRPYNLMAGGYDAANPITLSIDVYGDGFLEELNAYAAQAKEKGATVLYGFTPMNALALGESAFDDADLLYEELQKQLKFEILGHPAKYILDKEWFYDNNVHANSYGAIIYTDVLAEDLKLCLGVDTPSGIELPDKPSMPERSDEDGEEGDEDCFLYEVREDASGQYAFITGLTEEGKKRAALTIPSKHDGLPVISFAADVFAGNKVVSRIILPASVTTIVNDSFNGASRLSELVFRHTEVLGLSVGQEFLRGADNCLIYVRKGVSTVDCAGGWAKYQSRLRYY